MKYEPTGDGVLTCKYCGSASVVKYGTYKGTQRYFCRACNRKFKADNTLFHMRISAGIISDVLDLYYGGLSVRDIYEKISYKYDYLPSRTTIYHWVKKYTIAAIEHFKQYHPETGSIWIFDETIFNINNRYSICVYDMMDTKTRFLLSSRITLKRSNYEAHKMVNQAIELCGKRPRTILLDNNYSYLDGIEKAFIVNGEPVKISLYAIHNNIELVERFDRKGLSQVPSGYKFNDIQTCVHFIDGWCVYYNFFRPNKYIHGRTPAEAAHIDCEFKSWSDFITFSQGTMHESAIIQPDSSGHPVFL